MIAASREPDRAKGREQMCKLIQAVSRGVPAGLTEVRRLGSTLKGEPPTRSPASTGRRRATDPPRRSTDGWNTCAAQRS